MADCVGVNVDDTTCSIAGCEKAPRYRGLCKKHYEGGLKSGELKKLPRLTLKERLLAKTDQTGDCWVWRGSRLKSGYGQIGIQRDGRTVPQLVHRVSYEIFIGPIPDGLQIDHLCRNTSCLNPSHLEAVTPSENMHRGMSPVFVIRRSGKCKYGHELTPENTYTCKSTGYRRCRKCQRRQLKAARDRRKAASL